MVETLYWKGQQHGDEEFVLPNILKQLVGAEVHE